MKARLFPIVAEKNPIVAHSAQICSKASRQILFGAIFIELFHIFLLKSWRNCPNGSLDDKVLVMPKAGTIGHGDKDRSQRVLSDV
jgi:hypothetical protein